MVYKNITVTSDFGVEATLKRIVDAIRKAPRSCNKLRIGECNIHQKGQPVLEDALSVAERVRDCLESKSVSRAWL